MNKTVGIWAGVGLSLVLLVLAACSRGSSSQKQDVTLKEIAGPPPDSLDQYFPPKSPAPVYLIEMFTMAGPFDGIGVDLQEQDAAGIKANFQAFQAEYDKMSKMVPEWTSLFPADPVTALGKAVDSGNPAQIGPAMGQVGGVCGTCHLLYQVKVEQKYHWKSFDEVKVTDPVTKQEMKWGDYMTALAGAYTGITVDLQEGQMDNARKNFQAFSAQFKTMATDGCKQCHVDPSGKEIPRAYFVDQTMMDQVNKLGQALGASTPDAKAVGDLSGLIGNESCLKCHLVHLPAQNAKDTWGQFKDVLK